MASSAFIHGHARGFLCGSNKNNDLEKPSPDSGTKSGTVAITPLVELLISWASLPDSIQRAIISAVQKIIEGVKESLERIGQFAPDTQILVRCDKEAEHAQLVYLLSQCHMDSLTKISLMKPK